MSMKDKFDSLRRGVEFGLSNGKKNMIVDLDVLAAILNIGPNFYCAHGVLDGEWCPDCRRDTAVAREENDREEND
jgi:hypothetical protein